MNTPGVEVTTPRSARRLRVMMSNCSACVRQIVAPVSRTAGPAILQRVRLPWTTGCAEDLRETSTTVRLQLRLGSIAPALLPA